MPVTIRLRSSTLVLTAAAVAVGSLAVTLSASNDAIVVAGFDRALAHLPTAHARLMTGSVRTAGAPVAGSEAYWLDQGSKPGKHVVPASHRGLATAADPALALGSRMTLTDGQGRARTYEAIEIRPVDAGAVRTASSQSVEPLLLVTWREVGPPAGAAGLMRMIMDASRLTGQPADPQHAL
jgi:hypothetical protein